MTRTHRALFISNPTPPSPDRRRALQALAQPGCIPIMELLVRHGADVNGLCWAGSVLFILRKSRARTAPVALDHGADPNRATQRSGTAWTTSSRLTRATQALTACIEILLAAGAQRATTFRRPSDAPRRTAEFAASSMPTRRLFVAVTRARLRPFRW